MKQNRNRLIFTALAAVALLATGCSKEPQGTGTGDGSATGKMVSVTLPIGFGDAPTAAQSVSAAPTTKAVNSTEDGFTVSFGEQMPQATATNAPATRAIARDLTNVWVFQFDASGANVATINTGTLAAGDLLTAPALQVGDGYTIYVMANGTTLDLSINRPTLKQFETEMGPTEPATDAATLPLSGKLTGVSVVDLGDGTGKLKLMDASPLMLILTRIHAEVTLSVDFDAAGYALTGAELYNVPVGATYGWNSATTTYPSNPVDTQFEYRSTSAAGMASLTPTTDGTKTTYKWFVGDNRRGDVAGLTTQSDRNSTNASAYATFARVTLTNSTTSTQKIFYNIYLGSGSVTNFDLKRNYTYTATAAIKGTAEFQEALIDVDGRVSGAGFSIFLTDNELDSPILISPKRMESAIPWTSVSSSSVPITQDFFNGKANTDVIMATSATDYPAAKYCRDKGAKYYLPSLAELMLMWTYLPAIPDADRPTARYLWSSNENGIYNTWGIIIVGEASGSTLGDDNDLAHGVRCVRETNTPVQSWNYPKVENGNIIVSRDGAGGIKTDALLTTEQKEWLLNTNTSTTIYDELSEYNKVSAKFEVASTDASASDTWNNAYDNCKNYSTADAAAGSWRVPTQRELMLMWMLKSQLTGGGYDNIVASLWSSTECSHFRIAAYTVDFSSNQTVNKNKDESCYVRCVRDL